MLQCRGRPAGAAAHPHGDVHGQAAEFELAQALGPHLPRRVHGERPGRQQHHKTQLTGGGGTRAVSGAWGAERRKSG